MYYIINVNRLDSYYYQQTSIYRYLTHISSRNFAEIIYISKYYWTKIITSRKRTKIIILKIARCK